MPNLVWMIGIGLICGTWSSLKQHMTLPKTQYQYVEFSMDDTWSLLKQHKTKAKTQYQNIEFSMDDRDWFDMMVHGHH